jgi:hypothetical protein
MCAQLAAAQECEDVEKPFHLTFGVVERASKGVPEKKLMI